MAVECVNYNCDALEEFLLNTNCKKGYPGGAKHAILFDCDSGLSGDDFSNGTLVLAALAADKAVSLENVKIRLTKGSATTVESPVDCSPPIVIDYAHAGTIFDGNVNSTNDSAWQVLLDGRTIGAMLFFNCGEGSSGRSTLIEAEISFNGDKVFPGQSEFQRYEIDFAWTGLGHMAKTISTPPGVFD